MVSNVITSNADAQQQNRNKDDYGKKTLKVVRDRINQDTYDKIRRKKYIMYNPTKKTPSKKLKNRNGITTQKSKSCRLCGVQD